MHHFPTFPVLFLVGATVVVAVTARLAMAVGNKSAKSGASRKP